MTQTNNERELFETDDGKWDGVIRAFWRRIQGYQKCEFNDIKDLPDPLPVEFRAHFATALLNAPKELRTPISQNDQQESVTNLWEALGKWSAYLASNGEQANLAPPSWLIDAVSSATSPPKQIPDGWKPSEAEILKYASEEELFLFADESDLLGIANGILELVQIKINASPTTSLTSETNTEVGE